MDINLLADAHRGSNPCAKIFKGVCWGSGHNLGEKNNANTMTIATHRNLEPEPTQPNFSPMFFD
jgi:hypothetical protein